jgi:hypothetical protein
MSVAPPRWFYEPVPSIDSGQALSLLKCSTSAVDYGAILHKQALAIGWAMLLTAIIDTTAEGDGDELP